MWGNLDYRFQLENENLTSQRHELDAYGTWGRLEAGLRYFYANALSDTDLDEPREQIRPTARFRISDDWYLRAAAWYDLGENPGLRVASYGAEYVGQCMTFGITTERRLTDESSGDSGTQIMLRIGLKNLGEFETSGIDLGSGSSDDDDDENDLGFDK